MFGVGGNSSDASSDASNDNVEKSVGLSSSLPAPKARVGDVDDGR